MGPVMWQCYRLCVLHPAAVEAAPTPKNRGAAKTAAVGPAQGTSMGSMAPLKTSSSVSGATTWFLSHTASPKHDLQAATSAQVQSLVKKKKKCDDINNKLRSVKGYRGHLTESRPQLARNNLRVVQCLVDQGTKVEHLMLKSSEIIEQSMVDLIQKWYDCKILVDVWQAVLSRELKIIVKGSVPRLGDVPQWVTEAVRLQEPHPADELPSAPTQTRQPGGGAVHLYELSTLRDEAKAV